jgi:DNA-binding transcriptional LysR family regulator
MRPPGVAFPCKITSQDKIHGTPPYPLRHRGSGRTEFLSCRRATEHVTTSIEHQIRLLEQELGVKLFERSKRHVLLTEAGARFVEEGRKALAQVDHVAKVALSPSNRQAGHLSIGMIWERRVLVDSMRLFTQRHPDVHVDLHRAGKPALINALKEGRLQIAFTSLIGPQDQNLTYETLGWEPLVVGLPHGHPLAAREKVPLRSLATEQYIAFHREVRRIAGTLFTSLVSVWRRQSAQDAIGPKW